MFRKTLKSLFVLSALFAFSATAQAAGNLEKFYTVDSYGSTAAKDTFYASEKPFLYMRLSEPGINYKSAIWYSPFNSESYLTNDDRANLGSNQEVWFDLSNWSALDRLGAWQVNGNFYYQGQPNNVNAGIYNFQVLANLAVTPEPASMILFLVGGLALAAVMYSRKKTGLTVQS